MCSLLSTAGSNPALSVESANPALAGFEPQKGVGKEFSHVVGVTRASRASEARGGRAPMEIRLCGFGFQSRPLRSSLRYERHTVFLLINDN